MTELYDRLHLITLDRDQHLSTCGYWYLVQSRCRAHTAFARRESLVHWLEERGLKLTKPLPDHGTHSVQEIEGAYRVSAHLSYDEFFSLLGDRTRTMSNGDYTLAIITSDADGLRTVHHLNPNCRDRPTFNHAESRAIFG